MQLAHLRATIRTAAGPLLAFALCLPGWSQTSPPLSQSPAEVVAKWYPKTDFDGELFPSFILTTNGRSNLSSPSASTRRFGDPNSFAGIEIIPMVANAQTHVAIQIDGFTDVSTIDVVLPEAGQHYLVVPVLRYDYAKLAANEQSVPGTINYAVRVNGIDLGTQTLNIRIRSVNDALLAALRANGKWADWSFLFAGYVDESAPFVQTVLQEALQWHAVNSFNGYQSGSTDQVRLQVFALWNVLQRHHLHYSSTTTTSASSPTGHVLSQAVRFIDQSIQSQQANCVDGSVLFASLLYKIGIEPILVIKPGHMFLGYYVDPQHHLAEYLETTLLGEGDQSEKSTNSTFSPRHPVQTSESWRQFIIAVQYADKEYSQEVEPHLQTFTPQYVTIDIAKARKGGVNAIPRHGI